MTKKILILSGDGVGPEIVAQAEKILSFLNAEASLAIELDYGLIGGIFFSFHIFYARWETKTNTKISYNWKIIKWIVS